MKANFSGFHPKPWKDNVDLSEPEPSQEELETILDKHAEYYIRETMKFFQENGESPALSKNNSGDLEAKAAINSLTLKQVLSLIGPTEVVPPNFKKLLPDHQEQMSYKSLMWARNDLKKSLRQSAERIWS